MPHLHLSLQSGDDMILKRMKRRHLRADALEFVAKVRALRPDMVFGADIIAGFPTETDEMFENSLRIVGGSRPHLSARLSLSRRARARRRRACRRCRAASARRARRNCGRLGRLNITSSVSRRVGTVETVLVEHDGLGRTEQFVPIKVPGHAPGEIVMARATGLNGDGLVGEAIRTAA